jgi:hypothetical protein
MSAPEVYIGHTSYRNQMMISFGTPKQEDACGHEIGWQRYDANSAATGKIYGIDYIIALRATLVAAGIEEPETLPVSDGFFSGFSRSPERDVDAMRRHLIAVLLEKCEVCMRTETLAQ